MNNFSATTFVKSVNTFFERSQDSQFLSSRRSARLLLGLPVDHPIIIAGGQPLFLGGPPKVLGKLITLRNLKKMYPGLVTVYRVLSNDVPQSDREFSKTFIPGLGKDQWIGLSRNRLHSTTKASAVSVPPDRLSYIKDRIKQIYGRRYQDNRGIQLLFSPEELFLSQFNLAGLQNVARRLEIEPDYWLVDICEENTVFNTEYNDHFLDQWQEYVAICNRNNHGEIRCLQSSESPFWLYDRTPHRFASNYRSGVIEWVNAEQLPQRMDLAELKTEVRRGHLSVCYRALARSAMKAVLYDGQVTGSGSLYNRLVEEACRQLSLPLPPILKTKNLVFEYVHLFKEEDERVLENRRDNRYGMVDVFASLEIGKIAEQIKSVPDNFGNSFGSQGYMVTFNG